MSVNLIISLGFQRLLICGRARLVNWWSVTTLIFFFEKHSIDVDVHVHITHTYLFRCRRLYTWTHIYLYTMFFLRNIVFILTQVCNSTSMSTLERLSWQIIKIDKVTLKISVSIRLPCILSPALNSNPPQFVLRSYYLDNLALSLLGEA